MLEGLPSLFEYVIGVVTGQRQRGSLAIVLYLANLLVRRVFGISLLCDPGLHRWHKVLRGPGPGCPLCRQVQGV